MKLHIETRELRMQHVWRISRDQASAKVNVFIQLEHDGVTGFGEVAPNIRYNETTDSSIEFLERAQSVLESANPWHFQDLLWQIHDLDAEQNAAKAAIDMAVLDWIGKKLEVPLYRFFGLDGGKAPVTSYSIGIDTPEKIKEKIREAEGYPILKIKLGSEDDERIMQAVREATDRTVRVDANEGWPDPRQALEKIHWLAQLNVEFVEQPLPAGRLEDVAWLRERSPLPIVADEDVHLARDISALAHAYDGINIKIMKSGGLLEALRMIHTARALGLSIMLGCMIESSLAITAAVHLSPLVDWADLDGNLLLANDPFVGAGVQDGKLILPDGPGLGVRIRE
ncbi:MAG: dipeptide epimerase [candidate division KSB1 bacterium]|nr:dipeptide epimerase [candidate division KSB1 bacterium]MDQ7063651.1 dipeptide epimerase [candidate division KSB1 bacterium]